MRLTVKFSLVVLLVFAAGFALVGLFSYRFLQENAREEVLHQARLMMHAVLSTRLYTAEQIRPLLETLPQHRRSFLPQTVPAFAATEHFGYLRKQYPAYTYKEATLNPTNLRDRAVDWETDVINTFRNHADRKEVVGERDTPDGRALFLARPIRVAKACLECHSTPSAAPVAMIRVYGTANGFGWKLDEIVGAQIVSLPMTLPVGIANRAFRTLLLYLAAMALFTLIAVNVALRAIVVRPVERISAMADEISKGNLDVPELPASGKDEIGALARSFNRMYLSLKKAMQLLEGQ